MEAKTKKETNASRERKRRWRLKQGARYKSEQHRIARYRLDPTGFEKLLALQGNACRICQAPFLSRQNTYVDHNHKSGVIRGLLCPKCNTALGFLESFVDAELFGRVYAYLQTNGRGVGNFDFNPFVRTKLMEQNVSPPPVSPTLGAQ